MMHYYIENLGCSKNLVDGEIMMGLLDQHDYLMADGPDTADVIIVNTCGFIEAAKEESLDVIFDLLDYKKQGSCRYFLVAGCLAQRYSNQLSAEIPEVDAFIGTTTFDEIVHIIQLLASRDQTLINIADSDKIITADSARTIVPRRRSAPLKIAEGCDNRCTYCIIPKLRGRYRSRAIEDVVSEAQNLIDGGAEELILIAQDTSRYGIDRYGNYRLIDLLSALNELDVRWIRLQYLYPDILDEAMIAAIAKLDKVVNYFDIPIQHGSDKILKLMHRNTSVEQIKNVVTLIRQHCPDAVIRTTVIVGFPGESEADFQRLLDLVTELRFDKLGAFTYSLEEDTPAYQLPDRVSDDVSAARVSELMATQQAISEALLTTHIGRRHMVLIEEIAEDDAIYIGRTQYDAPEIDGVCYVHTKGLTLAVGDLVNVTITDSLPFDLIGDLLEIVDEHRQ